MARATKLRAVHPSTGELSILLGLIDEAYDKQAWHGPNLKGSIRRATAAEAGWRPHPGRHSIAEQVVHAAYWKYAVRRRLCGNKRGSFALKGSNWFAIDSALPESSWKDYVGLLDSEHRALRATVAEFPPGRLTEFVGARKWRCNALIRGIALHDVYHAGQIQLLKRLLAERQRTPAG